MGENPVKLNIGCGHKHLEGYINVDLPNNYAGKKPDVECDLRALTFATDSVDEILAIHVIEHFYAWEMESLIREWLRVLKPGGKLILELPCLEKILYFFMSEPKVGMTLWGLYGDPRYKDPNMVHKWAFTSRSIAFLLSDAGFKDVVVGEAQYHVPKRDMRCTGVKP